MCVLGLSLLLQLVSGLFPLFLPMLNNFEQFLILVSDNIFGDLSKLFLFLFLLLNLLLLLSYNVILVLILLLIILLLLLLSLYLLQLFLSLGDVPLSVILIHKWGNMWRQLFQIMPVLLNIE